MPKQSRFFTATNAAAIGIASVAATVNIFVGPFNAAMWLVPICMVGFAAITSILVHGALLRTESPITVNWIVRSIMGNRLGKRVAYLLHWSYRWNMRIVSPVFLYFVPSLFLVLAAVLLILAIRGQITPSG